MTAMEWKRGGRKGRKGKGKGKGGGREEGLGLGLVGRGGKELRMKKTRKEEEEYTS